MSSTRRRAKLLRISPTMYPHNKYRARRTTVDGIVFDSRAEASRYCELKLLERCGAISDLERQRKYVLVPKSKHGRALYYIADFVYTQDGETVVEDVKSKATATPVYKLKKRLMAEIHGIEIQEVGL